MKFTFKLLLPLILCLPTLAVAEHAYEFHVYGTEQLEKGRSAVELHQIYHPNGAFVAGEEERTPDHSYYETVEFLHGVTPWMQMSVYQFMTWQSGAPANWVGTLVRPQFRAPERWKLPVNASLSVAGGYQRPRYSEDTWIYEILPIVDKQMGRWYVSVNPSVERALHGPGVQEGLVLAPAAKATYELWPHLSAGVEYFANYGNLTKILPLHEQEQRVMPVVEFSPAPKWTAQFGVGIGATAKTDHLAMKLIVAREFEWGRHRE